MHILPLSLFLFNRPCPPCALCFLHSWRSRIDWKSAVAQNTSHHQHWSFSPPVISYQEKMHLEVLSGTCSRKRWGAIVFEVANNSMSTNTQTVWRVNSHCNKCQKHCQKMCLYNSKHAICGAKHQKSVNQRQIKTLLFLQRGSCRKQ